MKRNRKEEQEKRLRRMEREKNSLLTYYRPTHDSNMLWVPVEESRFIGWESTIVLNESASNRKDSHLINQVMEVLKWKKPYWIDDQKVIKLIRRANRRVSTYKALWLEDARKRGRGMFISDAPGTYNQKMLSEEKYNKLDDPLKVYFTSYPVHVMATPWMDSYVKYVYELNHKFPINDLLMKVDKAYSTHRGIPKATEWSQKVQIEEKLDQNMYYPKTYGSYGDNWWKRRQVHNMRKSWKSILKVATKYRRKHIPGVIDRLEGKNINYKV